MEQTYFTKYISILYRQGNRYYDRVLAQYGIGYGQQFYLTRIYENQGMSMFDLANLGHYDKGTVTKAIQKLVDLGYLHIRTDERDKRMRRLYTTESAEPVIQALYQARKNWHRTLVEGLPQEDQQRVEDILKTMAYNAYGAMASTKQTDQG